VEFVDDHARDVIQQGVVGQSSQQHPGRHHQQFGLRRKPFVEANVVSHTIA
jgi:hypothetical protein